jgi:hypothetical protein
MIKRFGFYFGVGMIAVVVWLIQTYVPSGPTIYEATPPMADKALDAFLELNRLLLTLGTSVLGAMGLLVFGAFGGKSCSRELWAVIAGAVSVGLSMYYGFVAYLQVMATAATVGFDPYNPAVVHNLYGHFYLFLVGVVFFAGFVYQNMMTEEEYAKPNPVGGS